MLVNKKFKIDGFQEFPKHCTWIKRGFEQDYTMRALHTFALEIQRGDDREPSRVSVVLPAAAPDPDGVLRLTPQCITLDELEDAINALQDELDVMRADARRVFTVRAGHA